jgi:hypothetical protein
MDVVKEAYEAGKEFGGIILKIYGDNQRWLMMKPTNVIWSEDYAFLRMMFGNVNQEMESEYFRGFDETMGVTQTDRVKPGSSN